MRASIRPSTVSRLAGAAAALWLCGSGAAWAGGGADLASLNGALEDLCTITLPMFGVNLPFCPQAPSTTQGVLQLAAWNLVPNEMERANNAIPLGSAVDAGNPAIALTYNFGTIPSPITAFPVRGSTLSNLLPNLKPLAFISSSKTSAGSAAAATQLYDTNANAFFYAVASGFSDNGAQPDNLFLFYDDPQNTTNTYSPGQVIAKISLPLVQLTGYPQTLTTTPTETLVPTTLQIVVPKKPPTPGSGAPLDCSASTVSGKSSSGSISFSSLPASQIGIDCAVVFASSPPAMWSHAIFEVRVPLIVTAATDPLYIPTAANGEFPNPIANVGSPFTADVCGSLACSQFMSSSSSFGIGPAAAPLCTTAPNGNTPCQQPTYPLCATLPINGNGQQNGNAQGGNGLSLRPAVAAYYAISTVGETLLSAALPGSTTSVCPF